MLKMLEPTVIYIALARQFLICFALLHAARGKYSNFFSKGSSIFRLLI